MREIDISLKENLHAEKVIVLVDACHSAAIGGGIGRRSAIADSTLLNRYLLEIGRAKGGLALLASAEANEVSFEDFKWGGGHGVFTHYLLEGMRGAADIDANGIITIGELFEYVRDNAQKATDYKQHPSIGTNPYDRNMPIAIAPSSDFLQLPRVQEAKWQEHKEPTSEREVTYTRLQNLLEAERWKDADQETLECMLKALNRQQEAWFGPKRTF